MSLQHGGSVHAVRPSAAGDGDACRGTPREVAINRWFRVDTGAYQQLARFLKIKGGIETVWTPKRCIFPSDFFDCDASSSGSSDDDDDDDDDDSESEVCSTSCAHCSEHPIRRCHNGSFSVSLMEHHVCPDLSGLHVHDSIPSSTSQDALPSSDKHDPVDATLVVPGVYEGGLQLWACAGLTAEWLLSVCAIYCAHAPCALRAANAGGRAQHAAKPSPDSCCNAQGGTAPMCDQLSNVLKGVRVLDMGSGVALTGCVAHRLGASVILQDFNEAPLVACGAYALAATSDGTQKTRGTVRAVCGDWGRMHQNWLTHYNSQHIDASYKPFHLILSVETVYNKDAADKVADAMAAWLAPNGLGLVGAKRCYFGCTGGVDAFVDSLQALPHVKLVDRRTSTAPSSNGVSTTRSDGLLGHVLGAFGSMAATLDAAPQGLDDAPLQACARQLCERCPTWDAQPLHHSGQGSTPRPSPIPIHATLELYHVAAMSDGANVNDVLLIRRVPTNEDT